MKNLWQKFCIMPDTTRNLDFPDSQYQDRKSGSWLIRTIWYPLHPYLVGNIARITMLNNGVEEFYFHGKIKTVDIIKRF